MADDLAIIPQDGQALPPGLELVHDVLTMDEEAALIALMDASGLAYYAADPDNPRSSTSYGWKYDFRTDAFLPCAPMPEGFRAIAGIAAAAAGVASADLVECLLNRYEEGAIIQPHLDKPVWEHVIGISLGTTAVMDFQKPMDGGTAHLPVTLKPRSLYVMTGDARWLWRHSLSPVRGTRHSITFRTASAEGRRRLDASAGAR